MQWSSVCQSSYGAVLLVLCSELSTTASASLAKSMFALLPPESVTALRLGCSALVLCFIFRPWRSGLPRHAWRSTALYGLALGCMNLLFYMAIQRVPLGVAVGIEIMGPLSVAVFTSRRWVDFVWIGLAVCGLSLLLPLGHFTAAIDPVGVCFAAGAGSCWALYIVFGKKASGSSGPASVCIGMLGGAALVFPLGLHAGGMALFAPHALALGFFLGIISSALPCGLEMYALSRMPARTFGTLMSLSPALAALSGFLFLGETLGGVQWVGLLLIVAASMGTSASSKAG